RDAPSVDARGGRLPLLRLRIVASDAPSDPDPSLAVDRQAVPVLAVRDGDLVALQCGGVDAHDRVLLPERPEETARSERGAVRGDARDLAVGELARLGIDLVDDAL